MMDQTRPPQVGTTWTDQQGYRLLVVDGERSFVFALPPEAVVRVGRDAGQIGDGLLLKEPSVSRIHCQLRMQQSQLFIEDLSRFGTWVNGEQVATTRLLRSGDQIRFGSDSPAQILVIGPLLQIDPRAREPEAPWPLERFQAALRQEVARASGARRSLAVFSLRWQEPQPVAEVAFALQPYLRPGDCIGSGGPGHAHVLISEVEAHSAQGRGKHILETLGGSLPSLRLGMSLLPYDEIQFEELERIADEAAQKAPPRRIFGLADLGQRYRAGKHSWMTWGGHAEAVLNQVRRVARHDYTTLIIGETGTGKELAAAALHAESARKERAFVAVNCGAIPEHLVESELFGHRKGSFTGAVKDHAGLFEQAQGGTLFLDELAELPKDVQVKLLRVLETREVRPVGATGVIPVDVRLVAATNADLEQRVKDGSFRPDLYFRLKGPLITLLPLRDRRREILPLAQYFVHELCASRPGREPRFSREAAFLMQEYAWPGNVRELRQAVTSALVECPPDESEILVGHLPYELRRGADADRAGPEPAFAAVGGPSEDPGGQPMSRPQLRPFDEQVRELERRLLRTALQLAGGLRRKKQAAEILSMATSTFWYHYRLHKEAIDAELGEESDD